MKRLSSLVLLLAACSGSKGSPAPFVFRDPHPEAKEIVYVPPAPTDPTAPIVDEIRVEKDVVCDGESNLVRVKAHTTDGHDAFLLHRIAIFEGLGDGPAAPVVYYSWFAEHDTRPDVVVFDKGHTDGTPSTRVDLPGVLVRPCSYPELTVQLTGLRMNSDSDYQFQALPRHAEGFEPVSYHWDFGDGTTEDTTTPVAWHDYWRLPQPVMEVTLLVTVTATDARGQALTGYVPVSIWSTEFEYPRSYGLRYIHAEMIGDRTVDAKGVVYQDWLLWHHEDAPVVLDRARVDPDGPLLDLSSVATLPGSPPSGQITIPPGEQLRVTVHHDFSGDPAASTVITFDLTNGDPQPALAHVTVFEPL
jgi:hypothetical protein